MKLKIKYLILYRKQYYIADQCGPWKIINESTNSIEVTICRQKIILLSRLGESFDQMNR